MKLRMKKGFKTPMKIMIRKPKNPRGKGGYLGRKRYGAKMFRRSRTNPYRIGRR